MIYRDGMVGAAGRAASTKPHQQPLEIIPVVVAAIGWLGDPGHVTTTMTQSDTTH